MKQLLAELPMTLLTPLLTFAAAAATPGNEQDFMKQLVAELRKGPSNISTLATKVKRPPTAPKYKAFLLQHPGTFKVDGDNVSLAKGV
jgi:hypothetical protein